MIIQGLFRAYCEGVCTWSWEQEEGIWLRLYFREVSGHCLESRTGEVISETGIWNKDGVSHSECVAATGCWMRTSFSENLHNVEMRLVNNGL
jgi:hypothetical protein